ncbi:MAG TPA: 2-amino-4-hydroxy-6-hydroxymethyldihydropteridine diphosphokinase [Thermoanaerobaculia bacterium]|nr:2-amino-4-hydroxy-6-hydroxymethyldihydropteridine diphosphokinase [Thermoanaerobaculia bacterium]
MTASGEAVPLRSCLIALGSNLGDRGTFLRQAVERIRSRVRLVRLSSVWESPAMDAPTGSPDFLNLLALGATPLDPLALLRFLQEIERSLGRVRRVRNAPRTIDLDLIVCGAVLRRERNLTLPHPRFSEREFLLAPFRELGLGWNDPATGRPFRGVGGRGEARRIGLLY